MVQHSGSTLQTYGFRVSIIELVKIEYDVNVTALVMKCSTKCMKIIIHIICADNGMARDEPFGHSVVIYQFSVDLCVMTESK